MCDSCPDMTVWNGTLVHSCRMDEWRMYGSYLVAQPQAVEETVPEPETVATDR